MSIFSHHRLPAPDLAGTIKIFSQRHNSEICNLPPGVKFSPYCHRSGAEYAEKNNLYLPGDTGKYKPSDYVLSKFAID